MRDRPEHAQALTFGMRGNTGGAGKDVPGRARLQHCLQCLAVVFAMLTVGSFDTGAAAASQSSDASPVSPTECTVPPRSRASLVALIESAPGVARALVSGTPVATPAPPTGGSSVDAETTERVTAAAREFLACYNAGDLARLFALYSDDYLFAIWGGLGEPDASEANVAEQLRQLETTQPLPEEQQISLESVADVRMLSDGRVVATVTNSRKRSLAVFVKVGDRYLVDWAYALLPVAGTPTP